MNRIFIDPTTAHKHDMLKQSHLIIYEEYKRAFSLLEQIQVIADTARKGESTDWSDALRDIRQLLGGE